jgi:hypothetical protein
MINHDMKSCDKNYSLNEILKNYHQIKKQILDDLKKNPNNIVNNLWFNYLSYDKTCQQNCFQCQTLPHLAKDIVVNTPFKIKTGQTLMLTQTQVRPFLKWTNDQIKGDVFTIKILITYILEDILKHHHINLLNSYICNANGYLLYEVPTINDELCHFDRLVEYKYTKEIVYGLLCQVIVLYEHLSKYHFSHGRPNASSFLFDNRKCDYTYNYKNKKYNIVCDYTLKLADVSYSSIKYNNVVLFPQNNVTGLLCNHFHHYKQQDETYTVHLIDGLKHVLPRSIDLYLVILSMMKNDNFFNTVMENQNCYDVWKSLWNNQEGLVEQRLIDNDEQILKGVKLYVDPYQHLFNYIL